MEMKERYSMNRGVIVIVTLSFIVASSAFAQIAPALSAQPAIPVEPENLAEAAGRYVAAAEYLNFLKGTSCGYAVTREAPKYETVVKEEVVGYFPVSQRKEVIAALLALKADSTAQARRMFDGVYSYYTKTEKLDGKTSCGFIVGAAITTRKMAAELLLRKAGLR